MDTSRIPQPTRMLMPCVLGLTLLLGAPHSLAPPSRVSLQTAPPSRSPQARANPPPPVPRQQRGRQSLALPYFAFPPRG